MESQFAANCKLLIACGRRTFLDSVYFFVMATNGVDPM